MLLEKKRGGPALSSETEPPPATFCPLRFNPPSGIARAVVADHNLLARIELGHRAHTRYLFYENELSLELFGDLKPSMLSLDETDCQPVILTVHERRTAHVTPVNFRATRQTNRGRHLKGVSEMGFTHQRQAAPASVLEESGSVISHR